MKSYIVILILGATLTVESLQQQQHADREPSVWPFDNAQTPVEQIDLGAFTVNIYQREHTVRDRLRLRKGSYKSVINHKVVGGLPSPILATKISHLLDLIPCKNLSLAIPDQLSSIRCRPLDDWLDGYNNAKSPDPRHQTDYAGRLTIRYRTKAYFHDVKTPKSSTILYILDETHVNERVKSLTESSGLTDLGFAADHMNLGFYAEYVDKQKFNPRYGCNGNVYLSINNTDRLFDDGDAYRTYIIESLKNGYLANIELSCSDPNQVIPIYLDTDLTIIKRQQFPYLTLKNEMLIRPMTSTWNYTGTISQTREPNNLDDQTMAYNTTIRIQSMSDLSELLNFNLDQTFAHKDSNTGFEEMIFSHPKLTAFVKSDWTFDSLSKSLNIYFMEAERLLNLMIVSNPTPAFSVTFDDKPEEPHLNINLKLDRNFLIVLHNLVTGASNSTTPTSQNEETKLERDEL